MMNPEMFTTDRDLVTIVPAISFAFGKSKDRSTENAAGATTAPKNNAAPSHAAKRMSLIELRISLDLSKTVAGGDACGPSHSPGTQSKSLICARSRIFGCLISGIG